MRDRVRSDQRDHARCAHHHGVPHDVVHRLSLQDCLRECDWNRARRCGDGLAESQHDSLTRHAFDASRELAAASVEHGDFVPDREPQDAQQVVRLAAVERGAPLFGVEIGAEKARQHRASVACSRGAHVYSLHPLLFRGQTLGKYRIVAPLGSGGFGTVYLAQDTWIDKKVAIKVPHRQGLDFGELLREPRLLASVSHPNIVAITTAEKQDNVFFIVMEYVPGETLENIIAVQGALELNRALDFSCQICNAVDHAHRQGVIHRDLRPANVLVGENEMLKVADFGTSRFLEIAAHGTTVIGSPPYMAPEQFHGKAVFASDLYSLGVTMYQMLTGVLPYDTPAPSDLDKLMSGELVTAPRLQNPAIPKSINDIVLKAMSPDLSDRYQRASDLLEDLLAAWKSAQPRRPGDTPREPLRPMSSGGRDDAQSIQARLRPRDTPAARFCWQCRKPLHARTDRCPFCGESQ